MNNRTIVLCYRKIIDARSTGVWEKAVWNDSYLEFKMQAQLYNQQRQHNLLTELLANVAGAEQLHFLVSASVIPHLRQLNEQIPDITDTLGISFLKFDHYRFELVQSDLRNISSHTIALWFFGKPITWHDSIGEHLLVSDTEPAIDGLFKTTLVALQPGVSIYSMQYN